MRLRDKLLVSREGLQFLNEGVQDLNKVHKEKRDAIERKREKLQALMSIEKEYESHGETDRFFPKSFKKAPSIRKNTHMHSFNRMNTDHSPHLHRSQSKDVYGSRENLKTEGGEGLPSLRPEGFRPLMATGGPSANTLSVAHPHRSIAPFVSSSQLIAAKRVDNLVILKDTLLEVKQDPNSYFGRKAQSFRQNLEHDEKQLKIVSKIERIAKKSTTTEGDVGLQSALLESYENERLSMDCMKELKEVQKLTKVKFKHDLAQKKYFEHTKEAGALFQINLEKKAHPEHLFDEVTNLNEDFHQKFSSSMKTAGFKLPGIRICQSIKVLHKAQPSETSLRPIKHLKKNGEGFETSRTTANQNTNSFFSGVLLKKDLSNPPQQEPNPPAEAVQPTTNNSEAQTSNRSPAKSQKSTTRSPVKRTDSLLTEKKTDSNQLVFKF